MIIWGAVTVLLGILFFLFLADSAKSKWFRLTPEEEAIVDERTRENAVVQTKTIKLAHIKEALKDDKFYCYMLISFFVNLQNGCTTIFSTQIIKDMGFDVSTEYQLHVSLFKACSQIRFLSFRTSIQFCSTSLMVSLS